MIDVGDGVAVEVAWDDDTVNRWVLLWYRYDPDRHERRNTVVGAYTESSEFGVRLEELSARLAELKATGEAEPVEQVSGVFHHAGYRAEIARYRAELRQRRTEETRDRET